MSEGRYRHVLALLSIRRESMRRLFRSSWLLSLEEQPLSRELEYRLVTASLNNLSSVSFAAVQKSQSIYNS